MRSTDGYLFETVLQSATIAIALPEGVIMVTAGGLKGYSGGNLSVPNVNCDITVSTHVLAAWY
jgi:hypothetical protein